MKKKVNVDELRLDMYVVELDRPWLDSPFLFQGFPLRSDEDIQAIRDTCQYVYIDPERGIDVNTSAAPRYIGDRDHSDDNEASGHRQKRSNFTVNKDKPQISSRGQQLYPSTVPVEEEIPRARSVHLETRQLIENIFEDIRLGQSIDADGAKTIVRKIAESVIRTPDAQMWLTQLKNKDEYTSIHSMNVCILSLAFGRHLGLPEDALNVLGLGALLHDVGKICVPLDILQKPDKLTKEEYEVMKRHPLSGLQIVSETRGVPSGAMDVVYTHHERASGSGYPRGLLSQHISLFSKIVAVVDVYDAVTSDRVYHHGMDTIDAMKMLYDSRYKDFDVELVEQFIQCLGVFPVGSLVELNSGEVGIVISFRQQERTRPKILLVLDPHKQPYQPPVITDLTQHEEGGTNPYYILKSLNSGSHGVNPADYILLLEQLLK